jgi:hypothetical protein
VDIILSLLCQGCHFLALLSWLSIDCSPGTADLPWRYHGCPYPAMHGSSAMAVLLLFNRLNASSVWIFAGFAFADNKN